GFALSPVVALIGAWPQMHLRHPTDVIGPPLISAWWERINDGSAAQETSFYLFLICLLMWVTGGWLAWCVLRWRKPMLGLIPAAAFDRRPHPGRRNGHLLQLGAASAAPQPSGILQQRPWLRSHRFHR